MLACSATAAPAERGSSVPDLTRRRRMLVLADLLLEPVHRRARQHDREPRAALDPAGPRIVAVRPAVGDRRLHARAREPAHAGRVDRRPDRPPAHLPGRARRSSALGSLLCSLAPSTGWLIAFRALQAVGGSMLNPVAMSIITNVFTDRAERAKAIGVWGGVIGLSMALGPLVGGLLVDAVGWRSVFWLNVPVVVAVVVLTARFVPESRAPRAAALRPGGPAADDRAAGRAHLRDHRGPGTRLGEPADRRVVRWRPRRRWSGCCWSSRGAPSRCWTRGSSPACRSRRRRSSRSPRSPRSPGSSSSTRSTCRTCAASRRCTPGCSPCRWPR